MTVSEAVELAQSFGKPLTEEGIRRACQRGRIPGATRRRRKDGRRRWHFSVANFLWWLEHRHGKAGPRPTKGGSDDIS